MAADLTIRQLKYFIAAADCGQFSMAAVKEHVSQSAITNAVSALEGLLGTQLFERLPHGVSLTLEGHDFYHHARHIIDSLHDAMYKSRSRDRVSRGVVRIGASYTVLGYFLPAVLARFKATYPDIDFALQDMTRQILERAVLAGEVDIGLALLSNAEDLSPFEHRILVRSPRQLWVAPSHPLAQIRTPTLKDVSTHPYIVLNVDEGEESTMRYWQKQNLSPNVLLRTTSLEALRGLVSQGFGVTILSDMVFRAWSLEGKQIETRPLSPAIPNMDMGTFWRKDIPLSPAAVTFNEFLSQQS
jgi:DNA-binding transcriptional LysR family regulator